MLKLTNADLEPEVTQIIKEMAELGLEVNTVLMHLFGQEIQQPSKKLSAMQSFVSDLMITELAPITCFIVGIVDKFTFFSYLSIFEQLDWIQT